MGIKLKKMIEERLEPIIFEKGFKYDKVLSKPREAGFTYTKYVGEELKPGWLKTCNGLPPMEYIILYKSSFMPRITVHLFSNINGEPNRAILSNLAGRGDGQDWWPISTKEQVEVAFTEIKEFLEKYAWDWFVLK